MCASMKLFYIQPHKKHQTKQSKEIKSVDSLGEELIGHPR